MADQIKPLTPNELAAQRPSNYVAGPATPNNNPYGKMDYSTNINGVRVQNPSVPAPAVVSAKPAIADATNVQNTMNTATQGAVGMATAKQNPGITYDAQDNMVITGGVKPDGSLYVSTIPKGTAGYVPNPATVAKQQQQQQQQKQQEADNALTATATGTAPDNQNAPSQNAPFGVDTNTPEGLAEWYNTDPSGFQTWAQGQGMSDLKIRQVTTLAENNKLDTAYREFQNNLAQIANGTYPLSAAQTAQLNAVQAAWESTITAQRAANDTYSNAYGMANARREGTYDPLGTAGDAQIAMSTGINAIKSLQAAETEALSNMRQAFMDNNFKAVTTAYNAYLDHEKAISDNLKTMYDENVAAQDKADAKATELRKEAAQKIIDDHSMSMQDKQYELDKLKLSDQEKKDAQDYQHQKNQDAIAAAELKLKQKEYDATYGFIQNNGQQPSGFLAPTDIPGVKKSMQGIYYFDPTQFTDKKQAAAAENVARQAGIAILSDKTDTEAVTNLTGALSNLETLNNLFKELAPGNFPLAKDFEKVGNAISGIASATGIYTTDTRAKIDAYNSNRDQLFKQINALAGGHPRINQQELEAAAQALPRLNVLNMDNLKSGQEKLQLTRKYLYNAIKAEIPNANLPPSGDVLYNSTDELLKAHPDRAQKAADLAKQGYKDEDIRTILNY